MKPEGEAKGKVGVKMKLGGKVGWWRRKEAGGRVIKVGEKEKKGENMEGAGRECNRKPFSLLRRLRMKSL